jgi:carbon-monoxide dehydrogenase large subunit
VGEAVAMVVAETQTQALDAAEAVVVDYEILPSVTHSEEAMEPGAPTVWEEVRHNILVDTQFGDAAETGRILADAPHVVSMDFHVDRVTGVPMEPRAAVAQYEEAAAQCARSANSRRC